MNVATPKKKPKQRLVVRGGRTTRALLLNDQVEKVICEAIVLNVPLGFAAMRLGIDRKLPRIWWRKGQKGIGGLDKERYAKFYRAVEKAKGEAIAAGMVRIQQAARGGQVISRTTVTKSYQDASGKVITQTTVTEKLSRPDVNADIWMIENAAPEHFGRNRAEIRALERELSQAHAVIDGMISQLTIKLGSSAAPPRKALPRVITSRGDFETEAGEASHAEPVSQDQVIFSGYRSGEVPSQTGQSSEQDRGRAEAPGERAAPLVFAGVGDAEPVTL